MKSITLTAALALSALAPAAFAAGVEADLQTGRRWAKSETDGKTDGVQLNEAILAARYSPWDNGLSVGPTFTYSKWRSGDLDEGTSARNFELGLEAKYAYPVTQIVSPYAKARYVAYSRGKMDMNSDGTDAELDFRTYGFHLGLGAAVAVTEKVQLTAEAGYGVQMIRTTGGKLNKLTVDGNEVALTSDQKSIEGTNRNDFNSTSFLVGVNVNI